MKKILIPIDSNFSSYDAIEYAINFFKDEQCQFYFLNTYKYEIDSLDAHQLLHADIEFFISPKRKSEKCLGTVIKGCIQKNNNDKHHFNAISECSNLIDAIRQTVKQEAIDLVVLPLKNEKNEDIKAYSKNAKNIIDGVRECPVMIVPWAAKIHATPKFVLISNFEAELPKTELENWYDLVNLVNGTVKIVTPFDKSALSELQQANQLKLRAHLETLSGKRIDVEYIETALALKEFAEQHSDYIICLMDKKPNFWRKLGVTHSRIANLGPLPNTPVIALHR